MGNKRTSEVVKSKTVTWCLGCQRDVPNEGMREGPGGRRYCDHCIREGRWINADTLGGLFDER